MSRTQAGRPEPTTNFRDKSETAKWWQKGGQVFPVGANFLYANYLLDYVRFFVHRFEMAQKKETPDTPITNPRETSESDNGKSAPPQNPDSGSDAPPGPQPDSP